MKKILSILLACTLLTACGTGETNSSYNRSYVGQEAQIQFGKIIAIYPVKIEGTSEVGVIGGAIAGGAVGSMIGGNTLPSTSLGLWEELLPMELLVEQQKKLLPKIRHFNLSSKNKME